MFKYGVIAALSGYVTDTSSDNKLLDTIREDYLLGSDSIYVTSLENNNASA